MPQISVRKIVLIFSLVMMGTTVSFGQRGGERGRRGFGGRGMDPTSMLLRSEQVQNELGLSEEQISRVESLTAEARNKSRDLFSGLFDLSEEERRQRRTKLAEVAAETKAELATVLETSQVKRLEQIGFQMRGIRSLMQKDTVEKLAITDEQRQQIEDLVDAQREMQREIFRSLRDLASEERRTIMEDIQEQRKELQTETEKAVQEIVTAEQWAKYQEMKGDPFEFDMRALFSRGFGRGGTEGRFGRGRDGERGEGRRRRPKRPEVE